jgi:hypothetical protein
MKISQNTRVILENLEKYSNRVTFFKGKEHLLRNSDNTALVSFETEEEFPRNVEIKDLRLVNRVLKITKNANLLIDESYISIVEGRHTVRIDSEAHDEEYKNIKDQSNLGDPVIISTDTYEKIKRLSEATKPQPKMLSGKSLLKDRTFLNFYSESDNIFGYISRSNDDDKTKQSVYLGKGNLLQEIKIDINNFIPINGDYKFDFYKNLIKISSLKHKVHVFTAKHY